jgi:MFS family permease
MLSPPPPGFLATRRGRLTLTLLCAVAFLDFVDATIVNVAMPSIGSHLRFSVQNLQWVLSAYLVTYGGFLLLGGRAADLLGRRRLLVGGTTLFAVSSLACGLADSPGVLIGARLVQGVGAAAMSPAAMSLLTTTFHDEKERYQALGAWSAMIGLASASGMILGGVLSEGIGWRWVFFVNLPVCVLIVAGAYRLLDGARPEARSARFDAGGAALVTTGMLLLIYGLVRAPEIGWGSAGTIGGAWQPPTSPRYWRPRGSTRRSSSSRCTCRTCWATARSRPGRHTCRSRSASAWRRRSASSCSPGSAHAR